MEKHEVVIAGAGPGGLKAAKTLEEEGKEDILLIEALPKKRIGDKFCGGMVPPRAVDLIGIPESLINTTLNKADVHIDGLTFDVPYQTRWVKRIDLGQYQLSLLKKTELRDSTKVMDVEPKENYITTLDGERIAYNYLIDGSGFKSPIKRKLSGKSENYWQCSGYMIKTKKQVDDAFHFYIYTDMNASLFWTLPYTDLLEVTVAYPIYGSIDKERARQHMEELAGSKDLSLNEGEPKAAPVPWDYKGFKFGNIFLLGDAAGLPSTIIGDGIYQSAKCGEMVAKTITNKGYDWERELKRDLLKHYYIGPGMWINKVYGWTNAAIKIAHLLTNKMDTKISVPEFIGKIARRILYNW
jgi:Dehydrogenases (flavoproteins)